MPPSTQDTAEPDALRPKYVPLRPSQYRKLTDLARDLQDARTQKTERITENTVIRVAVDLVTAHPGLLVGDTEDELREYALKRLRAAAALITAFPELLVGDTEDELHDAVTRLRAMTEGSSEQPQG
ncbi:hypothetical protein ABT224_36300 [Streptomyces sp. NPDC001584]|uniref:hypothetical protein n=1 Tax=Streptomyces sp. NPDC001584 TaxID=3154521 RepID=UPI0033214457